jgi:tetratricopeptide (TPR) repeat protein
MMRKVIVIFILLFTVNTSNAQLILRFAEYNYRILNYPDAIPFFKYYVDKRDSTNLTVVRKLADCYRLTNQYKQAEKYYALLVRKDTLLSDRLYYEDAKQRSIKIAIISDTVNITIQRLAFNSENSDFAPSVYKDKLIFASSIQVKPFIQRNHTWTETNFLSLQESDLNADFFSYTPFALELRTKYNFGPATFLESDSLMYYTTNNPKIKSKRNGYINLRIESAELIYGKWIKTDKFKFNSTEYACAHPSINKEGTKLYFSSNMPGGYGGMDLYVCDWINDSTWSDPHNLGPNINTIEEEVFPSISKENTLYFATNGRNSFGGLDIFYIDLSKPNTQVRTLPFPINSSDDDFALITYPNSFAGYFSSDRGNKGIDDDVYSFAIIGKYIKVYVIDSTTNKMISNATVRVIHKNKTFHQKTTKSPFEIRIENNDFFVFDVLAESYLPKIVNQKFLLEDSVLYIKLKRIKKACHVEGTITKKGTDEKLVNVMVKIYNCNKNQLVFEQLSNAIGFYKMYALETNTKYSITFSKTGYFSKELIFSTSDFHCSSNFISDYDYIKDMDLDSIIIGKAIKIDNIYFDLAKWNIRPDAALELDKIVKLLNDNPEIVIELSSHTDSRASSKYNETLSDKRAKSSAAYIISKGISESRIMGKGYGEYLLINKCSDGVKCSELEHQQNRRTEFKVLGFIE